MIPVAVDRQRSARGLRLRRERPMVVRALARMIVTVSGGSGMGMPIPLPVMGTVRNVANVMMDRR